MKFGVQFWPQQTTWDQLSEAARVADLAGFDSLWTWDHLLSVRGAPHRPIFEGWMTAAGMAGVTSTATIGLLVGANSLRNPGHTAKLAATLDHISHGRAVLGLGSGWSEPEHLVHGIDLAATPGARLDQLAEAVPIMRSLLDGAEVDHRGPYYQLDGAVHHPRPVQARLPILIGGSGPKKTLRIVSQHADMWNTRGNPAQLAASNEILAEHCAREGRDPSTIERTCGVSMVIRDDAAEAGRVLESALRQFGVGIDDVWPAVLGPPEAVADGLRPFLDAGFHHIILASQAPFDLATFERIGEVRELLGDA
ncbi:MAG TPA: LLM class flavin-dependent oxidoreductase [Candidatus Limnocylindrales bacterium]|nr:LLM class flavin-dependent oxidoreductase [Candidatus Limnocylindrales bacterium]